MKGFALKSPCLAGGLTTTEETAFEELHNGLVVKRRVTWRVGKDLCPAVDCGLMMTMIYITYTITFARLMTFHTKHDNDVV